MERLEPLLDIYGHVQMERCKEGDYVLYTDHLAVVRELVILCLDHGIISRGLACKYLGCAREDLDETVKEDSDEMS